MKSEFFNILIDIVDTKEALIKCKEYFNSAKPNTIFFLNAHCFNIASVNKEYNSAINSATLLLNDGVGIKLAAYFAAIRVKENMNGTDLIPKILQLAREEGKKAYILGSKDEFVKKAVSNISRLYGSGLIAGYHSGYFDKDEELKIIHEIANKDIDLLIVGMGVPKQELWILDHIKDLTKVKIIIAGGAIIDFSAGKFPRAPKVMQIIGLEWLYRLINEPKRLFKRYIIGNFVFIFRILIFFISRSILKKKQDYFS
jgi:N-acetylglucosaminyldiphosphoundecaprenol N-acetyl-beta-D-mannosaminyltransferase